VTAASPQSPRVVQLLPWTLASCGNAYTQTEEIGIVFSAHCLLAGHDDLVMRAPDRIWLQCQDCGRQTPGWILGPEAGSEQWGGRTNLSTGRVKTRRGAPREFAPCAE
jgi:hypothetical protein